VRQIVERAFDLSGILEIGPGPGILTSQLAQWDRKLTALELDSRMIPALAESAPYADVRQIDALHANFSALLDELPQPRGIVGNLPYYITAPLIDRIAAARNHYAKAILMIQKEVADRICALPGDGARGSISVYLQALFDIETVAKVGPEAFDPPPKVRSTVLEFRPKAAAEGASEELFRLVRLAFAQPRKTLANNLMAGLKLDRTSVAYAIESASLRPDARPHQLTELEWVTVARALSDQTTT
jgi:16S rRNA (adenine1518-N6/adenine1519-N6)-dimethyltransferase